MKSTTFPPMKVGKNQKLLPSGVKVSADGKYHYWQCSVSGLETFAKPDYWVKVMAKFKTEENLVKTYVCKKAQKLLDEGLTQEEIIKTLSVPETPAAKKEKKEAKKIKAERKALTKRTRKKGLKSFAVASEEVQVQTDTGSFQTEVKPVYPWQNDPNYFKGAGPSIMSVEEATKDSCLFPARHLDDECRGCPVYDKCVLSIKFTEKDWKSGKRAREQVVVKALVAD